MSRDRLKPAPLTTSSELMQPAITDEQVGAILPGCQHGDPLAVEQMYDLYADRLYRYFLARVGDPDVAADLTTELFLRVMKHLGKYRPNSNRLAASFSAWLYRIAANQVTDHNRARLRQSPVEFDHEEIVDTRSIGPERRAERNETIAELQSAMVHLSEEQRLVIIGKFAEEMSNAEIAALLGKTEGAVKSLQHRALRALGRVLTSHEH